MQRLDAPDLFEKRLLHVNKQCRPGVREETVACKKTVQALQGKAVAAIVPDIQPLLRFRSCYCGRFSTCGHQYTRVLV
jgi:hypothetical protein